MKKVILIVLFTISKIVFSQNANLVAYFPLDGDVNDYSPLHINGVNHNAVPTQSNTHYFYHFNGVDSYIYAGYDNRGIANKLSVSVWVRTTSNSLMWVVGHYNHVEDRGFQVVMQNGHAQLRGRDSSGNFYILSDNDTINDGQWHHIVGLYDNNQWYLIVDCAIKNTLTTQANIPNYAVYNKPFSISKYPDLYNGIDPMIFDGDIDDIRVYNDVLTLCEICSIRSMRDSVTDSEPRQIQNNKIKIFPNPSKNKVIIKLSDNKKADVFIYDMTGKLVFSKDFIKFINVNTRKFSSGEYLVVVMLDDKKYTSKLIIY